MRTLVKPSSTRNIFLLPNFLPTLTARLRVTTFLTTIRSGVDRLHGIRTSGSPPLSISTNCIFSLSHVLYHTHTHHTFTHTMYVTAPRTFKKSSLTHYNEELKNRVILSSIQPGKKVATVSIFYYSHQKGTTSQCRNTTRDDWGFSHITTTIYNHFDSTTHPPPFVLKGRTMATI